MFSHFHRGLLLAVVGFSTSVLAAPVPGELGQHVNSFIGTGGIHYLCANLSPGAMLPLGMVRLGPDTAGKRGRKATNKSGYYYDDPRILGFSHTRLSGTGAVDGGHFLVVPGNPERRPDRRHIGMYGEFSHDDERAFPGYYRVDLPKLGVLAELTATSRVGVHRYTFSKDRTPQLQIHVTNALGNGTSKEGQLRVVPENREVEGAVRTFGTFSGRYGGIKVYFVARANQSIANVATWQGETLTPGQSSAVGDDVGVHLTFEAETPSRPLELKLAISYVSIAAARANLNAETADLDFDDVLELAKMAWEEKLARARITGGTPRQRTIYYTALYHALIMPSLASDVGGEYFGFDRQVHRARGFNYYTDMSLWDTFRTVHPLYTLIAPGEQRDMVRSLVAMARQGGYLPRWPSGNGYTNSMFGTPADLVIAETYLKGIRDFDAEFAYQAALRTALEPTPSGASFSGRNGLEAYLEHEYCPADEMKKAVSRTLEYCYADYCLARLADALGHHDDAKRFDHRAQYYRNVWNPDSQYFHPRNSDGAFVKKFRPFLLTYFDASGKYTNDYVEGSAAQWRWAVPHDPAGLISLFKSRDFFVSELEDFFANSTPQVAVNPNGYYWQGNQPDLYAVYLFNHAGRPDLTQKWVRWILEHKHGDRENGLDGNDDGGTLSAWYVLSSLGLYPTAGTDRYELTSPLWPRAQLTLGENTLTIVAENVAPENIYIKHIWLNGKPHNRTSITHAEIVSGGELRFELGPEPSLDLAK